MRNHATGLRQLLPVIGADPAGWTPAALRTAILNPRGREGGGGLKRTVTVLPSWLRHHATMGRCDPGPIAVFPTIGNWSGHHLPCGLKPADVERLFAACDRTGPTGLPDRAILLLLARPPLPREAGDALLAWLEDGRPPVENPHVFLRHAAPWRPFTDSAAVSKIVRRSIRRADLETVPSYGVDLLRHSAARAALEDGASLETIGTMLRHRSIETTGRYAKVISTRSAPSPSPGRRRRHAERRGGPSCRADARLRLRVRQAGRIADRPCRPCRGARRHPCPDSHRS